MYLVIGKGASIIKVLKCCMVHICTVTNNTESLT